MQWVAMRSDAGRRLMADTGRGRLKKMDSDQKIIFFPFFFPYFVATVRERSSLSKKREFEMSYGGKEYGGRNLDGKKHRRTREGRRRRNLMGNVEIFLFNHLSMYLHPRFFF